MKDVNVNLEVCNVNPGLINPGWLIVVAPPDSDKWLLKWYPPIKQPRGLLIQACINDFLLIYNYIQ